MAASELRAWISERAQSGNPMLMLDGSQSGRDEAQILRVHVQADCVQAADEQLADLMLDMRLLGLRPSVVRSAA